MPLEVTLRFRAWGLGVGLGVFLCKRKFHLPVFSIIVGPLVTVSLPSSLVLTTVCPANLGMVKH